MSTRGETGTQAEGENLDTLPGTITLPTGLQFPSAGALHITGAAPINAGSYGLYILAPKPTAGGSSWREQMALLKLANPYVFAAAREPDPNTGEGCLYG